MKLPKKPAAKPPAPVEDDYSDLLDEPDEELAAASKDRPKKGKRGRKKNSSAPIWWAAGGLVSVALAIVVWVLWPTGTGNTDAQAAAEAAPALPVVDYQKEIQPFFKQYCYDCHGPETQEAGLELHREQAIADLLKNRKAWDKVYTHVKIGAMPPSSSAQPNAAEREKVVAWLDHTLHFVDCTGGADPGRVTIRGVAPIGSLWTLIAFLRGVAQVGRFGPTWVPWRGGTGWPLWAYRCASGTRGCLALPRIASCPDACQTQNCG